MVVLMSISRQWSGVKTLLQTPKKIFLLALSAVLIGGNWLLFIWAVNNHHMLEASLGYFINPLVNIVLGMLFLGERFRRMQWLAVLLAACGVLVQLWTFGSLPIIALGLAFSVLWPGAQEDCGRSTNRHADRNPVAFTRCSHLSVWHCGQPNQPYGAKPDVAQSAADCCGCRDHHSAAVLYRRGNPPASVDAGFFQYIGPTLMFLLAVTFYGEVPGADKMVTFAFIWVALAIFVMDAIYTQRRVRRGRIAGWRFAYPAYKSTSP
jgi:chloramphenicol-sensitive protein RarD